MTHLSPNAGGFSNARRAALLTKCFCVLLAFAGLQQAALLGAEPGAAKRERQNVGTQATPARVYRYTDNDGRTHYVGSPNQIPSRFRSDDNAVELAHIRTHRDIGDGLRAEALSTLERATLSEQLDAVRRDLLEIPLCTELREQASNRSAIATRLWQEHPHLLVLGSLALCLILLSRRMAHWLPAGQWSRLLTFMLPALLLIAACASGVRQATSIARSLRSDAAPCDPGLPLADGTSSEGVTQRQSLISRLRTAAHHRDQATADVVEATIREHYRAR